MSYKIEFIPRGNLISGRAYPRISNKKSKADSVQSGYINTFYQYVGRHPGGGILPYKRLIEKCRWTGSHFHDWSDYNGVAFSIDFLEWGRKCSDFWGK